VPLNSFFQCDLFRLDAVDSFSGKPAISNNHAHYDDVVCEAIYEMILKSIRPKLYSQANMTLLCENLRIKADKTGHILE
jgi:hypothetical protein